MDRGREVARLALCVAVVACDRGVKSLVLGGRDGNIE